MPALVYMFSKCWTEPILFQGEQHGLPLFSEAGHVPPDPALAGRRLTEGPDSPAGCFQMDGHGPAPGCQSPAAKRGCPCGDGLR